MKEKAKESKQVQKARNKLKLQLIEEHKLITNAALQKVSEDIKHWIARHANERIKLKDKDIGLFDSNKHSAKVHSKFVKELMSSLQKDSGDSKENSLEGRIKKDQ